MSSSSAVQQVASEYPARLDVEYPKRDLDRLTTFFRILTAIPIVLILSLLSGPAVQARAEQHVFAAGGVLWLPTMLMLVFRRKYPWWWFDWNLELIRFNTRVSAYLALLSDEYPSTDEEQGVHIEVGYPDARELSRWLPLVKWFLAIPHYVVLAFLGIAAIGCVIIAWFAILITGRYPRPLFDFVVGVLRWWLRVGAYAFLLTTDRYPPFRLSG
jgi:uncharacterized protein DUF4389